MTFGCKFQIQFCHFFPSSDFVIMGLKHLNTGYLVDAASPKVFTGSFLKLYRFFVKL